MVVPAIPGGSSASVELRAWKSSLGATYEAALTTGGGNFLARSAPVVIILGGGGTPPAPDANLVGLQPSFIICPEPSVLVLAALGAGVLGRPRRGGVGRRG